MDPTEYRKVALAVWGPLVAVHVVDVLQVLSGGQPIVASLVDRVGPTPVSIAMGGTLVLGAVALANSDLGDRTAPRTDSRPETGRGQDRR